MNNENIYISEHLRDALVIAWTIDGFKKARVTLEVICSDGQTVVITENLEVFSDDTMFFGSSSQPTPVRSAVDQLSDIKTNVWF
jgi:archaellum biogenesis ATPase FlaH